MSGRHLAINELQIEFSMGSEMEFWWLIFIKGRLCCLFTLPQEYKSLLLEGEQFAYLMFIAHALTRNYKGNKLGISP